MRKYFIIVFLQIVNSCTKKINLFGRGMLPTERESNWIQYQIQ